MKKRLQHPPAYIDGVMSVYDLVDVADPDNPDSPIRMIKARNIGPIPYRDKSIYDRTRLIFEQAGVEITHKLAIKRWDGISTKCVCLIDNKQYKVYNIAQVETRDGYLETEVTLVTPDFQYEIQTGGTE